MKRVPPQSPLARRATEVVETLQQRFVAGLEAAAANQGTHVSFAPIEWLRDNGRHGGGVRWGTADNEMFQRASINVSTVHYDGDPERKLASASALSSIVHPADPRHPSLHLHTSFTEMRDGTGYWRVMADLNPSLPEAADREEFSRALRDATAELPGLYDDATAQGDRYFYIPALDRHRGVAHFYLESYATGSWEADAVLARRVEEAVIYFYCRLLSQPLPRASATDAQRAAQLAYHTAYLFQVLTLDRGTTSGLMIHDQNDEGILGSLPARVDRELLSSWASRVPAPQDELVRQLVGALPKENPSTVDAATKRALASAVRSHYGRHPAALELQASGSVSPPTVDNHR
jgi:coproporphyrinogen III oxidase